MKKHLLAISFLLIGMLTFAQLSEGKIKFDMSFSSEDPEMSAYAGMLEGSSMTLYQSENFSRADITMGTMMSISTVMNTKSKDILMLMDMSMFGMKTATKYNEKDEPVAEDAQDLDLTILDETKDILGYTCKKATLEDEDGNEMTFWLTDEINFNKTGNQYLREDVPGFPLEYNITADGMTVDLKASSIDKEISKKDAKSIFSMEIPEGYEEKSIEEMNALGQ